ncbi:MAG: hypothetical protein ACREP7_08890 [Lysobacter sp.]
MAQQLIGLNRENVDTLDRGLYRDRGNQENAIRFNQIASQDVQQVSVYLQILQQAPTSQTHLIYLDIYTEYLNADMMRLEQSMLAAQ